MSGKVLNISDYTRKQTYWAEACWALITDDVAKSTKAACLLRTNFTVEKTVFSKTPRSLAETKAPKLQVFNSRNLRFFFFFCRDFIARSHTKSLNCYR
ncbi:hypothetical protein Q3G72_030051 [Acer saccharum]|nr:hypothetical protein Q3G72_030051 [Acer saccharum]